MINLISRLFDKPSIKPKIEELTIGSKWFIRELGDSNGDIGCKIIAIKDGWIKYTILRENPFEYFESTTTDVMPESKFRVVYNVKRK